MSAVPRVVSVYSRRCLVQRNKLLPTEKKFSTSSAKHLQTGDVATETRTFSEDDVRKFADVTGDHNPVHLDADFARRSRFGAPVVHGSLTMGLVSGLIARELPGEGSVLMKQMVEYPAPLYVGEEVVVRVEVLSYRHNIAKLQLTCKGSEDKVVLKGHVHVLYEK